MAQYRLFDNIIERDNANSFVVAAKELLDQLKVEVSVLKNSKPSGISGGR